jgi:hypothetical protein
MRFIAAVSLISINQRHANQRGRGSHEPEPGDDLRLAPPGQLKVMV